MSRPTPVAPDAVSRNSEDERMTHNTSTHGASTHGTPTHYPGRHYAATHYPATHNPETNSPAAHITSVPVESTRGGSARRAASLAAARISMLAALGLFLFVGTAKAQEDASDEPVLQSSLEIIDINTGERQVLYRRRAHFEAPNWSPDGSYILFNQQGRIYRLPMEGGEPEVIDAGFAVRANNDHGITADGKTLIISDGTEEGTSIIYTLPIEGGTPKRVTELGPSYWHGVSPDGRTLAYVGQRNGDYDIYSIPIDGGEETQLTTAEGLDDGPDYSPDGEYIYFNSVRTGTMQIYRMRADGSEEEQLTFDEYNDWFPHPSPDGKWIAFLSYGPEVEGHPANKDVMLRIMPADGGEPRVLTELFGGQGTINVPSWAPDSQRFAFVSYELIDE